MTDNAFEVEIRQDTGKGAARALRRDGKVPAIIYGGKDPETKIALDRKELYVAYQKGSFKAKVLELKAGKDAFKVLPRDVQLHPVTDVPLHVDFLRVSDDTKISVMVHVKFHNHEKSPGIKRGGVLNIVRHEVELLCPAGSIPSRLDADLEGLAIGDSVHISAIRLPEGAEPVIKDRDFTIATITGRSKKEDAIEDVATEEGAEAEGEEAATDKEGEKKAEDKK